ncbi:tetraacyldisaccharide 4'-kinase [Thiotrichales bacterium 19S11-10]|nr:tetraacyldisaccharide 4'-kinase [Thiotrichales bacterium 19S11-10]
MLEKYFLRHWYQQNKTYLAYLLMPIAWIYYLTSLIRRFIYTRYLQPKLNIPVIVIGNITLGGVGKTPLVEAIYTKLKEKGYTPGIISRGYGRKTKEDLVISEKHRATDVGDEPLMLYQFLQCPIAVAKKRLQALRLITKQYPNVDVIISDDGLQHYQLPRDVEIIVIDAKRKLGNELIFPAGPLREKKTRVKTVDFVIYNESDTSPIDASYHYTMTLKPSGLINLKTKKSYSPDYLSRQTIYAVAGIGNPSRFFYSLTNLGYQIIEKPFPDHYQYKIHDFAFKDDFPIIMTYKDAIKCESFDLDNLWYLSVKVEISEQFFDQLLLRII